jgi:uncharacterized protein YjbI with pentapeptide repeats
MEYHIGTKENYLDFGKSEYGKTGHRNNLTNNSFEFVNFNNSSFINCNLTDVIFKHCDFTRCDFTEIRQWNCVYENCTFDNARFYNASIGVNSKYSDCVFRKSKLYGKGFSFGHRSEFNRCLFENCDIKSTYIISTRFYECIISSKLTNLRFSGELEARVSTVNGNTQFPATFIKCNMDKSVFKNLEIMDGAILIETTLPDLYNERFNNDRTYYP